MKALFGGALALGAAMAISSGPAQAVEITISLAGPPNASAPTIHYDLPSSVFTDNGLPVGQLSASASNGSHQFVNAVRNSDGLGVRACSGFVGCLFESGQVDGLGGSDGITFGITNQDPGFEFILVSATFSRVNSLPGVDAFDAARLSFGGNDYTFDIADAANGQNPGSCFGILDAVCTVNFVDLLGGGDPFFMEGSSFSFGAPGVLDGWFLTEVVWEVGLQAQVPEPAALGLIGLGLAGLGLARRRKA